MPRRARTSAFRRRLAWCAACTASRSWASPARARCCCRPRTPSRSRASSSPRARSTTPMRGCAAPAASSTRSRGAAADRAERLTARVRAMHARVRGTLAEAAGPFPAGTPYRGRRPGAAAVDPRVLVDSAVLVYDQYVASMDDDDRERYWQDYKVIGRPLRAGRRRPPRHLGRLPRLRRRRRRLRGPRGHAAGARARPRDRHAPAGPGAPAAPRGARELR